MADLIFLYLKATVEKLVAFVGAIFGLDKLDEKKNHKARINALSQRLSPNLAGLAYFEFFMALVDSASLEDLNSFRSGILHKKGIADLQPHNYGKKSADDAPFMAVFGVMHEQHIKNSAAIVAGLAMLTDALVELDPPDVSAEEIMLISEHFRKQRSKESGDAS